LIYTLDLRPAEVLMDMLKFKRFLDDTSDDFDFVRFLAQGLVIVFAGKTTNPESRRYLVVASAEDLARVTWSCLMAASSSLSCLLLRMLPDVRHHAQFCV